MPINYSKVRGEPVVLEHDPDNSEVFTLFYRPETWTANKEVVQNDALYMPTVPNGCMYVASQGGITGETEPTVWKTAEGSSTKSGSVIFTAMPYGLLLRSGDSIKANEVEDHPQYEILAPDGFTIDSDTIINDSIIFFRITESPTTGTFDFIIRISVLRSNGLYTRYDDTIKIQIKES